MKIEFEEYSTIDDIFLYLIATEYTPEVKQLLPVSLYKCYLYLNKHIRYTKLQELRNTVDEMLRLQSKTALVDDTWRECMKILNGKGLITIWS